MSDIIQEFSLSPATSNIVNMLPIISPEEMMNNIEPADILVSMYKGTPEGEMSEVKRKVMSWMMGGFSSSKIVINNNYIAGYGANPSKGAHNVNKIKKIEFIKHFGPLCHIRVPNLTEKKKKLVVHFINKYMGVQYSNSALMKSVWDRFTLRKVKPFFEDVNEEEIQDFKDPLYCSTLISFAYLAAGVNIKFSKNPYDVWPKDFITSSDTIKLSRTMV